MRYKDLIIRVSARRNLEALSAITNVPVQKIKPTACIEVFCKDNKIRDWKWLYRKRRSFLGKLLFG